MDNSANTVCAKPTDVFIKRFIRINQHFIEEDAPLKLNFYKGFARNVSLTESHRKAPFHSTSSYKLVLWDFRRPTQTLYRIWIRYIRIRKVPNPSKAFIKTPAGGATWGCWWDKSLQFSHQTIALDETEHQLSDNKPNCTDF